MCNHWAINGWQCWNVWQPAATRKHRLSAWWLHVFVLLGAGALFTHYIRDVQTTWLLSGKFTWMLLTLSDDVFIHFPAKSRLSVLQKTKTDNVLLQVNRRARVILQGAVFTLVQRVKHTASQERRSLKVNTWRSPSKPHQNIIGTLSEHYQNPLELWHKNMT